VAVSARDPQAPLPERPEGRGRHARGRDPRPRRNGVSRWVKETAIIVVAALVVSALVRAFLVQAFYVPSPSMEDTLRINDRVVASKISTAMSGVQRGEIVVFRDPGGWLPAPEAASGGVSGTLRSALTFVGLLPSDTGHDLVKRVVGVGGDRVSCCDADGRIVLNGVSLVENYVKGSTDQVRFDVVVPDGGVFVMGDNRGDSSDSRYHLDADKGAVPTANVVGRAVLVVWPLARWTTLSIPDVYSDPRITRGARPQ
jgi:signal peptidase I